MYGSPTLLKVVPRKPFGVLLEVEFSNDGDAGDKRMVTYTVDFANPPADWLARRVADTLVALNSTDIFAKLFQPGPIEPFVQPAPTAAEVAKDAYFAVLMQFQRLSDLSAMGQITAAQTQRDELKQVLEATYDPAFFGLK